jgi:hypothetical protein
MYGCYRTKYIEVRGLFGVKGAPLRHLLRAYGFGHWVDGAMCVIGE